MGKIDNVVLIAIGSFIAGILLAPKSGKETRQDLMDKTDELKGKAKESLRDIKKGASFVKDEIDEGFESFKDIAKDAGDDAKRTANRLKDETAERAEAVKAKAQQSADEVKRGRN